MLHLTGAYGLKKVTLTLGDNPCSVSLIFDLYSASVATVLYYVILNHVIHVAAPEWPDFTGFYFEMIWSFKVATAKDNWGRK